MFGILLHVIVKIENVQQILWLMKLESYDEEAKPIPTNFSKKKATSKTRNFYILLAFLLITVELLTAVSI